MMTSPTGTIFRIARFSVHDGPGIRTTVFLKGCPLRCQWCHSPESQSRAPQLVIHADRCLVCGSCLPACEEHAIRQVDGGYETDFGRCRACGACAPRCPSGAREIVGRVVSVDDIMAQLDRDLLFFEESGGGVTFSGGEPLMQPAFLEALLVRCRQRRIRSAVDTCGVAEAATFARILPLPGLFLFDLKFVDNERHRAATGVSNVPILENLRTLAGTGTPVRIRFPLVPGLTDSETNVEAVGRLLRSLGLQQVDVLPYHRAGVAKYPRLGIEYPLPAVPVPDESRLTAVIEVLASFGLQARISGRG